MGVARRRRDADYIRGHSTTLYHAASTCRMGTDDPAVVDPKRAANRRHQTQTT
ncbi:GMC oxidoreductase [Bradyrhizobium sp. PMVTL-01]|uniref:GMC oxidoreductase n=1 Tax=unclassified Bradyrhizobium TaxID=2631580 RepID=UPI003F7160E0